MNDFDPRSLANIAKPPRSTYKRRIVALTGEDLHDFVLFADRVPALAARAGCFYGRLTAASNASVGQDPDLRNPSKPLI
jgi:hypothetical protein